MEKIAYFRVSTHGQCIDAQRHAIGVACSKEFIDEGVSGAVPAMQRAGFSSMIKFLREGDNLYVYDLSRLGRDAIDVQDSVRRLLRMGVNLHVNGLGAISNGAGEIIVAVLSQVAAIERERIVERCSKGREVAKALLATTGRTHKGKTSLGRPRKVDRDAVCQWKIKHMASISDTAKHFNIGTATVSRCLKPT